MKFGLINNFSSELAQDLPFDSNTLALSEGSDRIASALRLSDMVALTIIRGSELEIVYATKVTGASVTVMRGCEGTVAKSYQLADNVIVEARATAEVLSSGPISASAINEDSLLVVGNDGYSAGSIGGGLELAFKPDFSYLSKYSLITDIGTQQLKGVKESNTGAYLYTAARNSVDQYSSLVFDVATGAVVLKSSAGSENHFDGIFSPDDSYLVIPATYEDAIYVYDTSTWQLITTRTPSDMSGRGDLTSPANYWGIRGGVFVDSTRILLLPELDGARNVATSLGDAVHYFIYDVVADVFVAPSIQGPSWLTAQTDYLYPRNVKVFPDKNKAAVVYQWNGWDLPVGLVVFDYDQIDGSWVVNTAVTDNLQAVVATHGHCDFVGVVDDRYLWVKHSLTTAGNNGIPPFFVVDLDTDEVRINHDEVQGQALPVGSDSGAISADGRYAFIGYESALHVYRTTSLEVLAVIQLTDVQSDAVSAGASESGVDFSKFHTGSSGQTYITFDNSQYIYSFGGSALLEVLNYQSIYGLGIYPENPLYIGNSSGADGSSAIAFGSLAISGGDKSVGVGSGASAGSSQAAVGAVAVGNRSTSLGAAGVALGPSSTAESQSVALGYGAAAEVQKGLVSSATPYISNVEKQGLPSVTMAGVKSGTTTPSSDLARLVGVDFVADSYELISVVSDPSPYKYPFGWDTENLGGAHYSFGSNLEDNSPLVLYSPTGDLVVTISGSRLVFADPDTGAIYKTLYLYDTSYTDSRAAVFTPDGRYLIVSSDVSQGYLYKVDLSTFTYTNIRDGGGALAVSMSVSPDGRYLAIGKVVSPGYEIFDLESSTQLTTSFTVTGTCRGVRFTPDGQYLILSAAKEFSAGGLTAHYDEGYYFAVHVGTWELVTEAATLSSTPVTALALDISVSPDSSMVAAAVRGPSAFIFSTETWDQISGSPTTFPASPGVTTVQCAAFSPDGAYLAFGHRRSEGVTIYRVSDWSVAYQINPLTYPELFRIPTNTTWDSDDSGIVSLEFSPDMRYLTISQRSRPAHVVFDLVNDEVVLPVQPDIYMQTSGAASFCAMTGTLYLAATADVVNSYRMVDGKWVRAPDGDDLVGLTAAFRLAASHDGTMLAVTNNLTSQSLRVFTVAGWVEITGIPDIVNARAVEFSPDDTLLAVRTPTAVKVLSTSDWSIVSDVASSSAYSDVRFTPDGTKLVYGDLDGLHILNVADWSPVTGLENIGDSRQSLDISPDSTKILVVANDSTVISEVDIATQQVVKSYDTQFIPNSSLRGTTDDIMGARYLGDSGYVVATFNNPPGVVFLSRDTLEYAYDAMQPADVYDASSLEPALGLMCSSDWRHFLWKSLDTGRVTILSTDYVSDNKLRAYAHSGGAQIFSGRTHALDCTRSGARVTSEGAYGVTGDFDVVVAPHNGAKLSARLVARGYYLEAAPQFDWAKISNVVWSNLPTVTTLAVSPDESMLAVGLISAPFVRLIDLTTGADTPVDLVGMALAPPDKLQFSHTGTHLLVKSSVGSATDSSVGVVSVSSGLVVSSALPTYTSPVATAEFFGDVENLYIQSDAGEDLEVYALTTWDRVDTYVRPKSVSTSALGWPTYGGAYFVFAYDMHFVYQRSKAVLPSEHTGAFMREPRVVMTPDKRYTVMSTDDSGGYSFVVVYDNHLGKVHGAAQQVTPQVRSMEALPDNRHVVLGTDYNTSSTYRLLDVLAVDVVEEAFPVVSGINDVAVLRSQGVVLVAVDADAPHTRGGLAAIEVHSTSDRGAYDRTTYRGLA